MTQVTGNSITDLIAKESILSIQLSLNGLSFCIIHKGDVKFAKSESGMEVYDLISREGILQLEYKAVWVTCDTAKVCITPKELFDSSAVDQYMAINSIEIMPNEVIASSDINGDVIASIVVNRSIYDSLNKRFGDRLQFSHPLLINIHHKTKRPTVEANIGIGVVHITMINKSTIVYAESLPLESSVDLLFYLQKLNELHPFTGFDILLCGLNAKQIYKDISRYFKNCNIDKVLSSYRIGGLRTDATAFNNIINVTL